MVKRSDPTKCGNGLHDWIPENIHVHPNGTRTCKPCKAAHNKARSAKGKARIKKEREQIVDQRYLVDELMRINRSLNLLITQIQLNGGVH